MKLIKNCGLIALVLCLFAVEAYCQVNYEAGYFIDNENKRVACLIENKGWKNNPEKFKYKAEADAEVLTADIQGVKEFGIGSYVKYVRASLKLDRSSPALSELSSDKEPEWNEEVHFLNVLVEGPAELYKYEDKSLRRFFYRVNDSGIEQLIYKKYLVDAKIGENKAFLRQLSYALNCDQAAVAKLESLRYTEGSLRDYFLSFNNCAGEGSVMYEDKSENKINIKITPGINYASYGIDAFEGRISGKTDRKPFFRIGLEIESVLPFYKNKWSLFAEPTYQYLKAEGRNEGGSQVRTIAIDYKYIDIPLGVRHYFFLSQESRVFVNAALVLGFNLDPAHVALVYPWKSHPIPFESFHNFSFGAGFMHNRLSAELRYFTKKNLTWKQTAYLSEYNNMSLILGYRIL